MIKRDGVEIMNDRTLNVKLAKSTLDVLKAKQYLSSHGSMVDISKSLDAAVASTTLYRDRIEDHVYVPVVPTIEVTNETTSAAAIRLATSGKENLVALNFASARNPGGGFLSGAIAQEEDLCRSSGLYACIKTKPIFYNENILSETTLYTDNIIYSPNVPFFRNEYNLFLETPYELSIVSAPAPNLRNLVIPDDDDDEADDLENIVYSTIMNRAKKILKVAHLNGHKNIILGAWGCGAFGNQPGQVAAAFHEALRRVPVFEHVTFAVYDTRTPPHLFDMFTEIFSEKT